jgi:hypothetical protein
MSMFLVIVLRDGPQYDLAKPLEEQSGWQEHAAFMDGLVDEGFLVLGGPLADEHRVAHVVEAASEDVRRPVDDPARRAAALAPSGAPWRSPVR